MNRKWLCFVYKNIFLNCSVHRQFGFLQSYNFNPPQILLDYKKLKLHADNETRRMFKQVYEYF